jgi:hypothetical protein
VLLRSSHARSMLGLLALPAARGVAALCRHLPGTIIICTRFVSVHFLLLKGWPAGLRVLLACKVQPAL